MGQTRARIFLAIFGLVACSSSGCVALLAGGAAGAAGYAYAKGSKAKVYPVSKETADVGVQNAVANLQVSVLKHDADVTGSRTEAKTAHGKKFIVETRSLGSATEVKVRVGTFGDDEWTDLIFAELDQQLGSPAAAKVASDPKIIPASGAVDNPVDAIPAVSESQ